MKKRIRIKELKFYLLVGIAWLALWIFSASPSNSKAFVSQSLNEIWLAVYIVVVNFIFFEYSLPFIMRKRSNILFNILIGIVLLSIQFILVSFGLVGWKYLGMQLHIFTSLRQVTLIPDTPFNYLIEDVLYQAQSGVASLLFFGISKLFYDNFKLKQIAQKLRLEKQEAELNYLKSQTNPHFLFNTLNNIYSQSRDKSDLAPESILRLSKILRFMLYETRGEFIRVEQELEIINDYIELEKIRYDETLLINFKTEIDDQEQSIPPLLLIPLVENAFKHGVSETSNKPFVDIHFSITKQQLLFVIKNSSENFDLEMSVKENIGLSNLRRQLELLYKEYDLSVLQNETVFTASLKINLASHV